MLSDEEKRRIEEEERHRAAVRAQIASEGTAREDSKESQAFTRVQSAQKTTNLRESVDNFGFWVKVVFGGIMIIVLLALCTSMGGHR